MNRGRSSYENLEPIIIDVLNESPIPLKILSINFKINEKSKKIISLNAVRNQLDILVKRKKVLKKTDKFDNDYYWIEKSSESYS